MCVAFYTEQFQYVLKSIKIESVGIFTFKVFIFRIWSTLIMAPKTTLWAFFVIYLAKCVSSSPAVILSTEWPEVELGSGMLHTEGERKLSTASALETSKTH
ncbi:hypothetical protein AMELA_G00203790, partial [Ameiurus melas]